MQPATVTCKCERRRLLCISHRSTEHRSCSSHPWGRMSKPHRKGSPDLRNRPNHHSLRRDRRCKCHRASRLLAGCRNPLCTSMLTPFNRLRSHRQAPCLHRSNRRSRSAPWADRGTSIRSYCIVGRHSSPRSRRRHPRNKNGQPSCPIADHCNPQGTTRSLLHPPRCRSHRRKSHPGSTHSLPGNPHNLRPDHRRQLELQTG